MIHKKELLQAFFDTVWTNGHTDAIPRFLTEDVQHEGVLPDMNLSSPDLAELISLVHARFSPPKITIIQTVENGEWISALVQLYHRPSVNEPIHKVMGQVMARCEGTRFAEMYNCFDNISFFEQIGLLPENAMVVLLAGTRLQ